MNIGRRGFMGAIAGIFGALMVPVKAVASVFKREVEFFEGRPVQEVLPGHLLCVRPAKGTRHWTVQLVHGGSVRVRLTQQPRGSGILLSEPWGSYACWGSSLLFIENDSERPALVGVTFQGTRTE